MFYKEKQDIEKWVLYGLRKSNVKKPLTVRFK